MRVTQIADLAGTTPRAIRHYHRLGLLEVPPTVAGKREYGVEHLARLLRIRWLAGSGLALKQVARVLADEQSGQEGPNAPAGQSPALPPRDSQARRQSVLRDLQATRGSIEAQRRSLAEQSRRISSLIARVEAGEPLAPVPQAVTRFYDALEARLRARGSDLRTVHVERHIMTVLSSLGMVPTSSARFVEDFDDDEIDLCAQQITDFSRLTRLAPTQAEALAQDLAARAYQLAARHRPRTLAALEDLPHGVVGGTLWRVSHVLTAASYPHPAQRTFGEHLLSLFLSDPDFGPAIRRSAGKDPVL